jgi:Cupin-like domain
MADADPGIVAAMAPIREVTVSSPAELDAQLRSGETPFVVRGLVSDWPLVKAGIESGRSARDYLLRKRRNVPFMVSVGQAGSSGRFFYDDAMGMNFVTAKGKLPEIFAQIDAAEGRPDAPPIYLSAIDIEAHFDGLHEENHVDLGERRIMANIWIGTKTRIAAHNDTPANLACVAAGKRRFTLFPREQFRNLYLGPVDNTPAGRAVSMVDFHAPDFAAHPRFREALRHAQAAELAPGDAIYIPPMWWHHVEGLEPFNILVNYWWRETPAWLGDPQDALTHAMLSIRDLPEDQKRHWRDMFDHYVFDAGEEVVAHIPPQGRSILAPLTAETAGRIRAYLLRVLSR